jgi:hypothetical protein
MQIQGESKMKQMIKVATMVIVCMAVLQFIPISALASMVDVDFRDQDAFGGHGMTSYETGMEPFGVNLTVSVGVLGSTLWRDNFDGYGIQYNFEGLFMDYAEAEIQGMESLRIDFSETISLHDVSITDLFFENGYHETGMYSLDNGSSWTFFQAASNQLLGYKNGEADIAVDAETDSILFAAPGLLANQNHEFSVGGLTFETLMSGETVDVVPTPIPSAVFLLGSGILGLGYVRKRINSN